MIRQLVAPHIDVPAFNGPFDLLLHLIEREALDITAISLAQVAEQYLTQVRSLRENRVEQLIDFLVIAARLVLIKSRALLPRPPSVPEGEEEEDPADVLVRQLQRYKRFKDAGGWLAGRQEQGMRTFLRIAPPHARRQNSMLDLSGVSTADILIALQSVLDRGEQREESVSVVRPPTVTIEGQLRLVRSRLRKQRSIQFRDLLGQDIEREEVAVTLLAALELIKRREITARQDTPFGPIELTGISATSPAPAELASPQSDQ